MPEADFTSGHFLGIHPRATGGVLTTGTPAVVNTPVAHRELARRIAQQLGTEDGVLTRTSLHGLIDALLACLTSDTLVLVDEHIYPIADWAVAAALQEGGGSVMRYRHLDARDARAKAGRHHVIVVTDGLCGSCLTQAPLRPLLRLASRAGGQVVVDDSLAMGALRDDGTVGDTGVHSSSLVCVASCAKAYGAPLGVVTGARKVVERIRATGPTQTHASPPTEADVAALRAALGVPDLRERRSRVQSLAVKIRRSVSRLGLTPIGAPFPVVSIALNRQVAVELHARLASEGVGTLVTAGRCTGRPALTMCLRADHTDQEIERLLAGLATAVRGWAA